MKTPDMQSSSDLLCIYPPQVPEFWPYVEKFLKAATERCGTWSIAEVRQELYKGALLWIVWDGEAVKAACVTRLIMEANNKILEVVACGGKGQNWRDLYEDIEDYGRNEGCVTSRIQGRLGWRRVFKDYDLAWVTLEKDLR